MKILYRSLIIGGVKVSIALLRSLLYYIWRNFHLFFYCNELALDHNLHWLLTIHKCISKSLLYKWGDCQAKRTGAYWHYSCGPCCMKQVSFTCQRKKVWRRIFQILLREDVEKAKKKNTQGVIHTQFSPPDRENYTHTAKMTSQCNKSGTAGNNLAGPRVTN